MKIAQEQANLFYRPFEFYTVAGLMYLVAVMLVSRGIFILEGRLARYSRSKGNDESSETAPSASGVSN
jgi:ABC-type amino acid transport system permease subunit